MIDEDEESRLWYENSDSYRDRQYEDWYNILNAINDKLLDELAMFMFENKQNLSSFKGARIVVSVEKDKLHFEFDND